MLARTNQYAFLDRRSQYLLIVRLRHQSYKALWPTVVSSSIKTNTNLAATFDADSACNQCYSIRLQKGNNMAVAWTKTMSAEVKYEGGIRMVSGNGNRL
jgi:hypothetical protein